MSEHHCTLFQHRQDDPGYGGGDGSVGQVEVLEHLVRQDQVAVFYLEITIRGGRGVTGFV